MTIAGPLVKVCMYTAKSGRCACRLKCVFAGSNLQTLDYKIQLVYKFDLTFTLELEHTHITHVRSQMIWLT